MVVYNSCSFCTLHFACLFIAYYFPLDLALNLFTKSVHTFAIESDERDVDATLEDGI